MKKLLFLGFVFSLRAVPSFAQSAAEEALDTAGNSVFVMTAPSFFVAVIAGVILAAAFQLLMTNLSVAAGLNLAGSAIAPDPKSDKRTAEKHATDKSGLDNVQSTMRKITSGLGIWTLVTTSISIFFAAWLAVLLSGTFSVVFGALLGLVIWGLFTLIMVTLEISAVSSLFGAVARAAGGALRGAYESTTSIFGKDPAKQAGESASEIAAAVREELLGGENLKQQLGDYFKRMESNFSPKNFRKELEKLLDDTEIEYLRRQDGPGLDDERIIASIKSGDDGSLERAKSGLNMVKQAIGAMREERSSGKSISGQVAGAAMKMAGGSGREAENYTERIQEHLRRTGREELNPEAIRRDLERLFSEPRAGAQALKERARHVDRQTVAAVLEERTDLSRQDAQRIVDQVISTTQQIAGSGSAPMQGAQETKARIESKIADFLASVGQPELQYQDIKRDLADLFHNPKAAGESLINRLRSIDRETIKSMIAESRGMSDEEAEEIIRQVEDTRDSIIERERQIVRQVQEKMEAARIEAQRQAEQTAKTAATAAWWAFFTAVISAAVAAVGGMMPAL